MKELTLIVNDLRHLDSSYEVIMKFLNNPEHHFSVINTSIQQAIAQLHGDKSYNELIEYYDRVINVLNDRWWDNAYPLHDSHFHRSFKDYCNCPFTSLTEITDCVEKCIGGKA